MMQGLSLDGRRALVTGGGGGIGSAICRDLADLGASVLVVDIDGAAAADVAGQLAGAQALTVDLATDDDVKGLVEQVRDLGGTDILVNNAGITLVERFTESDPLVWDRQWKVNLRAPMLLTQGLVGGMVDRQWGRLVYISSDGARAGSSGEGVYSACKAGLIGFGKTIAREFARGKVTSNVVCPGPIDTPMTRSVTADNPNLVEALVRAIPLRRVGEPEDVAGLVAFLCTDRAGYITGQTFSVSGGITMS
jgi:2-hydroxycyclohexanecarboxyl-CoA dehydrogenase